MTVCTTVQEFGRTLDNPPKFGKDPVVIDKNGRYYFADFTAKKLLQIEGLPIPINAKPSKI